MTTLQLPTFLQGSYLTVENAARAEGLRCSHQYQSHGTFTSPRELGTVSPKDVVFTHSVADLQHHQPAWRLYLVSEVVTTLCDTKSPRHIDELYEAAFRQTAWGALSFVLSASAPESAARTARRLQAVLNFWSNLEHGRYIHRQLNTFLTRDELLATACGWVLDAWLPAEGGPLHSKFERASQLMARATRDDCVEAILRQLHSLFPLVEMKKLTHPALVTQLGPWREHLSTLDTASFDRISAARPAELLRRLYQWDRQLGQAQPSGVRNELQSTMRHSDQKALRDVSDRLRRLKIQEGLRGVRVRRLNEGEMRDDL